MTKICRGCGEVKPLEAFWKHKQNKKDGHYNKCAVCMRAYEKQYRDDNIYRIREHKRLWARRNRDSR